MPVGFLNCTLRGALLSKHRYYFPLRTEFLNSMIAGVGHPYVSRSIQSHTLGHIEQAGVFPRVGKTPYELEVLPEDFDAAVFAVQSPGFLRLM